MAGVTTVKVAETDDGIRLNRWFLREYPSLSLSRLQKLLRTKQIKVDGKRAETSTRLLAGQEIRLPPLDEQKAPLEEHFISEKDKKMIQSLVIYKDDNIIALNKPSGLAVQGGTNQSKHIDGLLDALMFEKEERPRLVHRIDKDTSGILLLARNRQTAEKLTLAFREHKLPKTYLALVNGCPAQNSGEIDAPLLKVGEKMQVSEQGQEAKSLYKVIDSVGKKYSLLELKPLSGRTHQLRVHTLFIGCPIVGDDKYFVAENKSQKLFVDKLHLHAYKIDLSVIYKNKTIITAPLPSYFTDGLNAVGISFKE